MARPIGLPSSASRVGLWRSLSDGGGLSSDSATLTDANFAVAPDTTTGGAITFTGYDSVLVAVVLTGGTGPTATLIPLFRDEDAADGSRWIPTGSVSLTTAFQELYVWSSLVFPRLTLTGSPTAVSLLVKPGRVCPGRPFR